MTTLLVVLLWIVIAVAGVLVLLLAMPLDARAWGGVNNDTLSAKAVARWGWGVIALRWKPGTGAQFCLLGLPVTTLRPEKRKDRAEKQKRRKKRKPRDGDRSNRRLRRLLDERDTLARVVRRLLGALGLRGHLWIRVGLSDPADTAILSQTLLLVDRVVPPLEMTVEPDYLDEVIELEGEASMRIWPLEIVSLAVWTLITERAVRALIWPERAQRANA